MLTRHRFWLFGLLILSASAWADESRKGVFYGAKASQKPAWFKQSFLEFEADVAEAAAAGRRVMLYFHQDGCPYCARLIEENFTDPELKNFIVEHFDGIALNLWGDRKLVSVGGRDFTEKTFAAALNVQYTPTLVFLDERGKVALRLDGYYPPSDFRAALEFVAAKMEQRLSFTEYRQRQQNTDDGQLIREDFFIAESDLQKLATASDKPLVVYFEAAACAQCETMHQRILTDRTTRNLVLQADNVQFAVTSEQMLTTPNGRRIMASEWARELGIAYTPSLVFFDRNGSEVIRIGAFMKTFHFQSVYAYVLEKAHLDEPSFQRYLSVRAERIREAGFDTDIWGYDSFHD